MPGNEGFQKLEAMPVEPDAVESVDAPAKVDTGNDDLKAMMKQIVG